jgi:hypothetical protein
VHRDAAVGREADVRAAADTCGARSKRFMRKWKSQVRKHWSPCATTSPMTKRGPSSATNMWPKMRSIAAHAAHLVERVLEEGVVDVELAQALHVLGAQRSKKSITRCTRASAWRRGAVITGR